MNNIEQIKQVAVSTFLAILKNNAGDNGKFRMLLTVKVGDEIKPLLLIGTAHSRVEDGHVLAVLNPDSELCDTLSSSGYYSSLLKEVVGKRCDAALGLWIDAYKKDDACVTGKYLSKTAKPAKFAVT